MPYKVTASSTHYFAMQPMKHCPKCGSQDYMISETGKIFICEKCGFLTRNASQPKVSLDDSPASEEDTVH